MTEIGSSTAASPFVSFWKAARGGPTLDDPEEGLHARHVRRGKDEPRLALRPEPLRREIPLDRRSQGRQEGRRGRRGTDKPPPLGPLRGRRLSEDPDLLSPGLFRVHP